MRTINDLKTLQYLPLDVKIKKTENRITEFIDKYGEDGVYLSFSGGKDSTVLLDIIKKMNIDIDVVFVDVPTQYKDLKVFSLENVDNLIVLKPKYNFVQICEKYGFPLFSKEIAGVIEGARKYIKDGKHYKYFFERVNGYNEYAKGGKRRAYSMVKYKNMLNANFDVSNKCCNILKKNPIKEYEKKSGKHAILGTQAQESSYRLQSWLKYGCNSFNSGRPKCQPLMFWREQDILEYLYINNIDLASCYGDIIKKGKEYKTTGCSRTGCVMCGFGCHLDKPEENRFKKIEESHPSYLNLLDTLKNNNISFREAIEWCNKNIKNFHVDLPNKK